MPAFFASPRPLATDDRANLLDALPDALVVTDLAGRITDANATAESLFGRAKAQLIGLDLCLLTMAGQADTERPASPFEPWSRSPEAFRGQEIKVLHREVGCVRAWLRVRPLADMPGHLLLAFSDLRQQQHADAATSLRERHLAHIVESAEDGIVSVDSDQRIVVFNRGAEEMFGYSAVEVVGRRLEILLPKRYRRAHKANVATFGSGSRASRRMGERSEVVARRKNGEEFPAEASIMRFDLGNGAVFTAVIRDITERKRLLHELAESERRFRAIFDHTYQFVGLLRPDGAVVEINRTALRLVGVELRDVVGKAFWDGPWWRFSAESRDTVRDAIQRAATGQFVRYTVEALGSTGVRTIDFSLTPVCDESGRVVSIIPEGRDISELMRATAALRLSEARLAKAQRIARLGYFDWNAETGATYWSDEIYRILGITGHEAGDFTPSYASLLERVHPDDRAAVGNAIKGALTGERGFDITHRIIGSDGSERVLHVQAEVTFDGAGHPTRLAGMAQDVTESKRVEFALRVAKEQAEQANRAKSAFLANMSHELRTPLNAVIGFAEMMEMQTFGPLDDVYRIYASDIRESGQHLLTIINDILDMSKVEAGRQELQMSDISVPDVVATTVRLVALRAEEAGLTISVRMAPSLPPLHADERLIKQILLNLLSNAVKFTPGGGRIAISAAITGDKMLTIEVADNGIGMDPKDIPTALEPFGQIDSAFTRKFQGTGLGLPLVKSLAELHGGVLSIRSAPGAGTTVAVKFPAAAAQAPVPSAPDIQSPDLSPCAAQLHGGGCADDCRGAHIAVKPTTAPDGGDGDERHQD